jgi:hypothetical protein
MSVSAFSVCCLGQASRNSDAVWATSAKFALHAGSLKFNTQNEEKAYV